MARRLALSEKNTKSLSGFDDLVEVKIPELIEKAKEEAEIEFYEKREKDLKSALAFMIIRSKNAA